MGVFWLLMVPISVWSGLWKRVEYVTFLSIWALVITEFGAWQASRAEVKVDEAREVRGRDVTVRHSDAVKEER